MKLRTTALLLLATSCSHGSSTSSRSPLALAPGPVSGFAALPPSPEIEREVMGFLVVSDGERLMSELLPEEAASAPPAAVEARIFAMFGLDSALADLLDLRRPAAVAMLNPALLASASVRPYVAMLPIRAREQVVETLARKGAALERTPWGFAAPTALGRVYVGFAPGYALLAWRADLLDATRRLLEPELAKPADAPLRLHVAVANVRASFGSQMDALLVNFALLNERGAAGPDPQLVYALRGLKRLGHYTESLNGLELLADIDSGGITLNARLDGKSGGAFGDFVHQQKPGPAWGVQLLPRDSVMVYTTHSTARGRADDVEASVEYLAGASPSERPSAEKLARWRDALGRVAQLSEGELAYAVWPGRSGGLGVGGAYRIGDAAQARAAMRAAYAEVATALAGPVARALLLDPDRWAGRIAIKQRVARVANVEVDLIEVAMRWPAHADAERRSFEALFGPKLTLATAIVGDQALFALGADFRERLATMIGAARGDGASSVGDEPSFAEALAFRPSARVSMSYLDTGRMARFAAGLIGQVSDLGEAQRAQVAALLAQVGSGAIVSTTNAEADRFELTTHLPRSAALGAAKLSGALWRVALSPLVNPPAVPPMPLPPPHLMPSLTPMNVQPSL